MSGPANRDRGRRRTGPPRPASTPAHAQRQATLQLITAAEAAGDARVAEMNKQVAANLDKIITAL